MRFFHDDEFDFHLQKQGRQGTAIAPETAEFTSLLFDGTAVVFNDDCDNVQHLMNIDACTRR